MSERQSELRNKLSIVFMVALVVLLMATILLTCRQRMNSTGPYRSSYEGKIVDKSATITESQTGSGVRFRLSINGPDGKPFLVTVDREIYERARVGMLIKKDNSGVQLDNHVVGAVDSVARR